MKKNLLFGLLALGLLALVLPGCCSNPPAPVKDTSTIKSDQTTTVNEDVNKTIKSEPVIGQPVSPR